MVFSLAQHTDRRRRRVDRTLHVGLLVCAGLSNPPRRGERLSRAQLSAARNIIRDEVLEVWRPFTYRADGMDYYYRFVFQVLTAPSSVPVQTTNTDMDVNDVAEREGLFRDARSALEEARALEYENIAIVAPRYAGAPHGLYVSAVAGTRYTEDHADMETERRLNARGGVLDSIPNGIVLDLTDVESRRRTPAHETGHLLGLTNASGITSIMGIRGTDAQAAARHVTDEDRRLLHAVIESNVPGFLRPSDAQTIAPTRPFRFTGTYSQAEP